MNILPNISRALLLDNVASQAAERLQNAGIEVRIGTGSPSEDQLIEMIREFTPSVIIVRSASKITKTVIEACSFCVRIIARAGVGVDNIDVQEAKHHGILVINAPIGNTLSAIEHTCALILAMARQLHVSLVRQNPSNKDPWKGAKKLANSRGITEVNGKTLGIIGLGRIGSGVGMRMHALGMRVIGYDPKISLEKTEPDKNWLSTSCSLEEIWSQSDYISLHVPLSPLTRHLINREVLDKCKNGVRIINCSRGGVVDEEALLSSIESRKCRGAAIDVFEKEPPQCDSPAARLIENENVIVTPHTGGSSEESQIRVALEIVDSILALGGLSNGQQLTGLENAVNLNETGSALKKIMEDPIYFETFCEQHKILCELATVGGLFSLHNFNEEYENIKIKSFCTSYYSNCGSDLMEDILSRIVKSLLRDLLIREDNIFPDSLKVLVQETEDNFSSIFQFQDIKDLDSDIKNHEFYQSNNIKCLAYLKIVCQGPENQKILLGFGLMEDAMKEKSVYLCERSEAILAVPENIGDGDFLGPINIQLY